MASLDHAIAKNSMIQIIGRLASTGIGLFALVFMTRGLGDSGYGKYTTIIAFLQFVAIMIDFGLSLTANRLLGSATTLEEEGRIMGTIQTIRAVSAAIILGVSPVLAALIFPYPADIITGIVVAALSFFSIGMTQTLIPIFQKHLALDRAMLGEIIGRVILLGGMIMASWMHAPLIVYVALVTFASLVTYGITRIFATQILPVRFTYDRAIAKKVFRFTWPIAVSIMLNVVYLRTDLIILSWYRVNDFADIGHYGAAYRVLDILTGIATAIMGIMLPILTAAWTQKRTADFTALTQKSFNAFMLLSVPTLLIGVLLGRPLMTLIAGESFAPAGDILGILIIAMTAVYFSTLFGHLIVVIEKQRAMIFGYAAAALFGLSAYFITIPRYGLFGAAWSTVATELLVLIITGYLFYRTTHTTIAMTFMLKTVLAGIPTAGVFYFLRDMPVLATLTLGCTTYAAMLVLTRAVSMQFLRGFFRP